MQDLVSTTQLADEPALAPSVSCILSQMQRRREGARARQKANRNRIHRALKRLRATRVAISYSGAGDSGQIDSVSVYRGDNEIQTEKKVTILVGSSRFSERGWIDDVQPKSMALEDALREFVYDWIEMEHPGWENNDGASGECTIEVETDKFALDHTTYFTESEHAGYEL